MKTVPVFLKASFRCALQIVLDEICRGIDVSDSFRQTRRLLMLLRPCSCTGHHEVGCAARRSWRFEDFSHGRWQKFIDGGRHCAEETAKNAAALISSLTSKGEQFVHRGWSSWMSSQQGGRYWKVRIWHPVRSEHGKVGTLQSAAPPTPIQEPLPAELLTFQPASAFELSERKFSKNLQSFSRCAALGPSGMFAEHFRPVLEALRVLHSFFRAAEFLEMAQVPKKWWRVAVGADYGFPETNRRSSWHCGWRHLSEIGGPHHEPHHFFSAR